MAFGSFGYNASRARRRRLNSGRPSVRAQAIQPQLESLEPRQLLAALIGIQPNDGELLSDGQILDRAPTSLTFRFDETPPALNVSQIPGNIRITRSGDDGIFGNANDVVIQPGYIGAGENANEAIVRFASTLPDDIYRIDAYGTALQFELDLGAQVIAVVPQPITQAGGVLTQARDQIAVYFNNDNLNPASARDPRFYQLIFTNDTATNTDDGEIIHPTSISYDAGSDRVMLTFAAPLDELTSGPGTFRLRIGTDEAMPLPPVSAAVSGDAGSSYDTAADLGSLGRSQIVSASIIDGELYPLDFPGGNNDPGHRDLPLESDNQHIPDTILPDGTRVATKDDQAGVQTIGFVFRRTYGLDPFGVPLRNLITEPQKQRTRELFELYGDKIGVQFFEVEESTLPDLLAAEIPFFSVVTGDMRAVDPVAQTGRDGVVGIAGPVIDPILGEVPTAIVDAAEFLEDSYGGSWFNTAGGLITYLLGTAFADDLPPGTLGSNQVLANYDPEPVFPGDNDLVHAMHLFRPEGRDIDLYRFELTQSGLFSAETTAERATDVSFLDTNLRLYREDEAGNRELVARNDDYFSNDSFISLNLEPGVYYVGVSASGNDQYDPAVEDSGIGGTTSGDYELRLDFRPDVNNTLVDATGVAFDGDADGVPGGVYNFWFRAQTPENTLIVDKSAPGGGVGSLTSPFNNIATAIAAASVGDIVRIVGNGGADGNFNTLGDNLAYEIGFDTLSRPLQDGATLEVPRGVTVMVDAGAIVKLRRARIGVGSSSAQVNRSASALQVLGIPGRQVIFTSAHDETIGVDTNPVATTAKAGDWGGLLFRKDIDDAQGRFGYEDAGIFLNYVNHADLRYGGGEVVIDSIQQVVTPVQMLEARPTVSFNQIMRSADAAMSADPDAFEETNFHTGVYQSVPFTSDYTRVGPDIHGNTLTNNSINGLFVKISTPAGNDLRPMTVSGRWDDTDIVHVVSETLVVQGTTGGPLQRSSRAPSITRVTVAPDEGGSLISGDYSYKFTFVMNDGTETTASAPTLPQNVLGRGVQGTIVLGNLPLTNTSVSGRRIYRSSANGAGPYTLVAELPLSVATFTDNGTVNNGEQLDEKNLDLTARLDARLSIDPGTVVKLDGANIEASLGGALYAEGTDGHDIIFTSVRDDRYGAGSTFDTRNDGANTSPTPGDWGGIIATAMSQLSVDYGVIAFGGGIAKVEGSFTGFNAMEIHQANARVTHSTFSSNGDGTGGQAPEERLGRGFNAPGSIFIRGAQPVIVSNIIRDGEGPALNINPGALNSDLVVDLGRTTGEADPIRAYGDNQGALIRNNRIGGNAVNGMVVRSEVLNTESVWDDTDIVHVVFEEIVVPNFHTFGGLRLESSVNGSLVVKFSGADAGLTAGGTPSDQGDRIGGGVQIVGQPGSPVILTSLRDDSVGAGFDPSGRSQSDTDGNGDRLDPGSSLPTGPEVNNGTLIDNDVIVSAPGAFAVDPAAGGDIQTMGVTVLTQNAVLQNQNYFGLFTNYVDVGRNG
ncbi:MAG: pre-peptidase C-terminal domain-containing protein, partial [Planctomycetales bacterium]|nr:pre-peptidase C-terminal domain-containing protein [Planctomycetales bacterium]